MTIYGRFSIAGDGGIVEICPITEMGGGVEQYYTHTIQGEPLDLVVDIPWTENPNRQEAWDELSDASKDWISAIGFDSPIASQEALMLKVFEHIHFTEKDADRYRKRIKEMEEELRGKFERALTDNQNFNYLNDALKAFQEMKYILHIWETRDEVEPMWEPWEPEGGWVRKGLS